MCVCVYVCMCICVCMCVCMYVCLYVCHCLISCVNFYMFSLAFSQPATGPSSVCEGSNVTLQCVIVFIGPDNGTIVRTSVWTIAPDGILATTLPNHRQVFNSTTGGLTDLVIINVTLEDNSTVYSCTDAISTITSSVILNVTGTVLCANVSIAV